MLQKKTTVAVSMVKLVLAYAEQAGINIEKTLESTGLDPEMLRHGEARVPSPVFIRLWQKVMAAGDDPHPGLSLGRALGSHYPAGSVLFTMMLNSPSIGSALETLVRYHHIMADIVQPVLDKGPDSASLSWRLQDPDVQNPPHLSECLLCLFHTILATLSRNRISPVKVCFSRPPPRDTNPYDAFFNAEIVFDAPRDELVIFSPDLDLEIRLANPLLYDVLEKEAALISSSLKKDRIWSDKVIGVLSRMLTSGTLPDVKSVAGRLAVSSRSLQEKLKSEGTGFRMLLEELRKETALDHVRKKDTPICDLAFLLGYADQSAFHHAFKRWTGRTPAKFRKEDRISRFP